MIVFEPEPSELMRGALQECTQEMTWLRPWRLPVTLGRLAPSPLQRFVTSRCSREGRALPCYIFLELGARLWARQKNARSLHAKFHLRALGSRWAAMQVGGASEVVAPSNAARALFASASRARKILLVDLPHLRGLHQDLDRQRAAYPQCLYLGRYRAPDWAVVDQQVEFELADEIWVRGNYLRERLSASGVAESKIRVLPTAATPIAWRPLMQRESLHVLLVGLAAARNGTNEILQALSTRPWLRVHARMGEGAEPTAFVSHPQVVRSTPETLASVHAVMAPSLNEAYLPELAVAAASGIPIVATRRGAGGVSSDAIFAGLPAHIGEDLGEALDALYRRLFVAGRGNEGQDFSRVE